MVGLATIASVVSVALSSAAIAQPRRAVPQAQDGNVCFFTTSSGRTVSLDKLCGAGTSSSPSLAPASTAATGMFSARIKRRMNGIPVIDVTFNGSRKFEMIVDTGASGTLITRSMAKALQVPVIGRVRSTIADGSTVIFPVGRVKSLSIDGATIRDVDVAIAEQMDVGLLGHDFFNSYDVKIKQHVVEFYRR
nr:retropepsin-like aspartic protease [Leptolyngbya sp. FACHB-36]